MFHAGWPAYCELTKKLLWFCAKTQCWRGSAWPGLAWPGVAWLGLAWPGLAWPGLAWPGGWLVGWADWLAGPTGW